MFINEEAFEIAVLKAMTIPLELVNDEYDYVYDNTLLFGYIRQLTKKGKITKGNPLNFLQNTILDNSKYNNYIGENKDCVDYIDHVMRVARIISRYLG